MSVITINRIKRVPGQRPRARKCDQCGKTIPKGRKHVVVTTKDMDGYTSKHYHQQCKSTT